MGLAVKSRGQTTLTQESIRQCIEAAKKEIVAEMYPDGLPCTENELPEAYRGLNGPTVEKSPVQIDLYIKKKKSVYDGFRNLMAWGIEKLHEILYLQKEEERTAINKVVTCIIPTYEKEDEIDKTLESLLLQTRPIDQIVVVINGDTGDLTAYNKVLPYAAIFSQIVMAYPKDLKGKANALNWAFKKHCSKLRDTDFVLGIDADVICDKQMIEYLETDITKEPKAAGVMARYSFSVPDEFGDKKGLKRREKTLLFNQRHEFAMTGIKQQLRGFTSDILGGQATLFRASALKEAA